MDDKIDKLASSESISDIKALVQEQSNLILKLTETVNSKKERIAKLEESPTECEKQCLPKALSKISMEMILKPQMMCLTNALNYLTNWSLIFQEPVLTGRIG